MALIRATLSLHSALMLSLTKGVDAPPDKGSRTSPGKDSAGAIRVTRLLLALSSDVTATSDEATRALSTCSSSFALTPLGADALSDKGVDAPPDKGSRTSPGKDSAGAIRVARLLLALSSGVTATDDKSVRAFLTGSSSFALIPPGVDALSDKGVDAPPDKGSRTSPGKDSADAIKVARLLLPLSSDVTATDDEAMRAFSTGSSSFAIPNVSSATDPPKKMACSARGANGQGRVLHPSAAAVETRPSGRTHFSFSTRALAGLIAGWSSARGVKGQGRVLHPSVAAVETGPNGRAPFSFSTRALAGLVAGWSSARGVNGQGRNLHSSVAAVETGPNGRAPSSPPLELWRAWPQDKLLSPRMRCRASRRSHLSQGDSTSCRSQERSEDGPGRSGRCR